MKTFITGLMFCFTVSMAQAYSFSTLKDEFVADTKEVCLQSVKTGVYFDVLESDRAKQLKFGISVPLLAWRFIGFEPAAIYTPSSSNAIAEFGAAIPIRLAYIPIGNGRLLRDALTPSNPSNTILDRVKMGLYASQNITTGKFGFGLNILIELGN